MRTKNPPFVFSPRLYIVYVGLKHLYAKYQSKILKRELAVCDLNLKHVHHKIKNSARFKNFMKKGAAIVFRQDNLLNDDVKHILLFNKPCTENRHVSFIQKNDFKIIVLQAKKQVCLDWGPRILAGISIN